MKKVFLLLFIGLSLQAKVEAPNYNFSLDSLYGFKPGITYDDIKKKFGNGEIYLKEKNYLIVKFKITQIRYVFPLFVQIHKNRVLDFFARLPGYFSHDILHQSIINRFGPQNRYKKHEESATYIWDSIKGNKIIYRGTCTITCFPVHYAVLTNSPPKSAEGYIPLITKFEKAIPSMSDKQ